ncbi:hypothetical protein GCM10009823_26650 [Brevibacterium salitolerans]|uniref:SseB protein N-terminal domain-containing protein n=1 Tax=Brevibacterium salitolerans TaxID=1403566 RepID=A0ABN2X4D1_9MICO
MPEIPAHLRGALGGPADSAGVPWGGRELHSNPFAGDTGEADEGLLTALAAAAASPLQPQLHAGVVRGLAGVRLYAPVLPIVTESSVDERGLMHDNASDMAMVRLQSADGREATPAFTDIPALTAWHPRARPVPIEAERLGAAAVEEGAQLVVLDPGRPHSFLLRRPALWSFLKQEPWQPAWADAEVAGALRAVAAGRDWIAGIGMGPGSQTVHVQGPEVRIEIRVSVRPEKQELEELQAALAAHALLADRVDSLSLGLVRA